MKELLKEIISDFHTNKIPKVQEREIEVPLKSGKAVTLIGPRRSGKSFLLYHLMQKLIKQGVKKKNIFYLNFEDERFQPEQKYLDLLLQAYRELYPEEELENCFFFFDEIQNAPGWERFVRRIYDNYTKHIFLTGSNAQLLSIEIATALRGRTVSFEILPLSFREYLDFLGTSHQKKDAKTKSNVRRALENYIKEGGFPELLTIDKSIKNKVLLEYFDVMTYRDLLQRYQFSNIPVVKYFLKKLAANCCSYFSVHKAYNELRSQGYKLDKNLLYEVFDAAQHSYLCFAVKKFSYSELKQERSESKTYFIDNGLLNTLTFKFSNDDGVLLENIVYMELRRSGYEIFYYKSKVECDFIVRQKGNEPVAIQVCYDMNDPETREREIRGLATACKDLKLKKGIVITMNEEASFVEDEIKIKVIPAIRFLTDQAAI